MTKLYHSCGGFILVRTFEDCAEYVYFSNPERQVPRVGVFANAELEKYKYPTKELRTCVAAFEENRLFSTAAEVSLAMTKEMPYLGYINYFVPVGICIKIGEAWLAAIVVFYLWSVVARWIKLIE